MKKFFLTLVLSAIALCGYAQQKGDHAVGVNVGVAPCLNKGTNITNFGIGAKYQYNVTDPIRLDFDMEYWASDGYRGLFDITANVQYLFVLYEDIVLYPTIGIGYGHLNNVNTTYTAQIGEDGEFVGFYNEPIAHPNRFVFNVGIGGEYKISRRLSAGIEIKYQYVKDLNRLPINLGVTYHF